MEGCQFPLSSRRPRTLAGRDLDSYTMNLHFALAGMPSRVAEIIPPAIRTTLAGSGAARKAALDDFYDSIFAVLSDGDAIEVGCGITAGPAEQERVSLDHKLFESFAGHLRLKTYA